MKYCLHLPVAAKIAAVALSIIALGGTGAMATIHQVNISNFTFSPKNTVVSPGDTVRWFMVEGIHTTTSDPSSPKIWDSGVFSVGTTFDLEFTAGDGPGPFPYHCNIHALTMKDTIFVMAPPGYTCGDPNADLSVNIGDAVYLINYIFKGGPAPQPELAAGDPNCDGSVNIGDAVYLINYIFKGGDMPCAACP